MKMMSMSMSMNDALEKFTFVSGELPSFVYDLGSFTLERCFDVIAEERADAALKIRVWD